MDTQTSKTIQDLNDAINGILAGAEEVIVEGGEVEPEVEALDEITELALDDVDVGAAPVADDTVLDDAAAAELDRMIVKQEAYQTQVAAATVSPEDIPAAAAAPKKAKAKTDGATGAARGPRAPRDIATLDAGLFVTSGDVNAMSDSDKEQARAALLALRPTQVKIAEKFDNVFYQLAAGRAPSTYVMIAFDLLDKQKNVTAADIIATMKAKGLGDGTARSQTGQIMVLFDVLGIATRVKNALSIRADSVIAQRLRSLASAS